MTSLDAVVDPSRRFPLDLGVAWFFGFVDEEGVLVVDDADLAGTLGNDDGTVLLHDQLQRSTLAELTSRVVINLVRSKGGGRLPTATSIGLFSLSSTKMGALSSFLTTKREK